MLELKTLVSRTHHRLLTGQLARGPEEPKQRRTMVAALTLLLIALGGVLYHDRDFWFPGTQEVLDQAQPQPEPQQASAAISATEAVAAKPVSPPHKKAQRSKTQSVPTQAPPTPADESAPMTATATRTVLPPLEVEVVAGNVHHTIHPGSNSVRVDLQPESPTEQVAEAPTDSVAPEATVATNAAEHVQISADTAEIVSRPVQPGYPLLARQMKVEGSVILQALIGRDGLIQDLRVLSGPPILATAAQEAVKQWHFKPHYLGADAVETQAKITVNFTISTN